MLADEEIFVIEVQYLPKMQFLFHFHGTRFKCAAVSFHALWDPGEDSRKPSGISNASEHQCNISLLTECGSSCDHA